MKRFLLILGCAALFVHTGCVKHQEAKEAESPYPVTSPLVMDTAITKKYVCQIHSISHIELRAQEKGYLQNIYVDEGQTVKKGQLLFRIMPKIYEAELLKAQAETKITEVEFQNTKSLADKNVVSQNELTMSQAKLNMAKAEQALAQAHLDFTEIRAPFDGIIDRFRVRLGSLVNEGDLLTTLSDNSKMWVYFNVSESEYLDYKVRIINNQPMKVGLLMANNQEFEYPGVVETIEADFDNETGNVPFRATFSNPKALLRHGETGNILVYVPVKHGLVIPQKATFEIMDKRYVFTVDKNSRVKLKEITVEAEMPDLYVVSSGISKSDKIIIEGLRKVKEDDRVSYEYQDPRFVMSHQRVHAE